MQSFYPSYYNTTSETFLSTPPPHTEVSEYIHFCNMECSNKQFEMEEYIFKSHFDLISSFFNIKKLTYLCVVKIQPQTFLMTHKIPSRVVTS